ncbi:MAG TPA: AMP-binding protein, partial [Candidatus Limnocylindria bacterium]|nr:AMP-binding protein [Candidatus Limnocylindria bacterium]
MLELVRELLEELGPLGAVRTIGLDAALDRDLGIGSLERVELFLRIERRLGIRLQDTAMAEVETVRDLIAAVRIASPAAELAPTEVTRVAPPGVPAPTAAQTLIEVLDWHAQAHPERTHVILAAEDDKESAISYGALWNRAGELAGGLLERGIRAGDRVALVLRTEEAFFSSFVGILLAGGIPVPLYPPFRPARLEEYAARHVRILRNAEPRWLITFAGAARIAALLRPQVPSLQGVITTEDLARAGARPMRSMAAGDAALIQYTSGSTGDPKGVLLTHDNLLANIRAIGQAIAIGPEDIAVSWLPLYHDMGLIGAWLCSLYFGIPVVLHPPLAFLARPSRWLRTIHRHRATLSPAPNFAFDLCARRIPDEELAGLDLSSWRLAMNGSEPVSPDTIDRFSRRFGPHGFRPEAMCPVYGLAESSVGLTMSPVGRAPRVDRLARPLFERDRQARPASPDDPAALRFVSCGLPLPAHEIRIVGAQGQALREREEGRIEFRGPSTMRGYFRNPEATQAVFHDDWVDTGDLGYRADGELFVTGRSKDVVIVAGRNLYPQEIEELIGDVPGVRRGCVAAFGVPDPTGGTERLVVAAETRQSGAGRRRALEAAIRERVLDGVGLPPDAIALYPPGSVPRTSSGKIRRRAAREAYLQGALGRAPGSGRAQILRLAATSLTTWLRRGGETIGRVAFTAYVGMLLAVTGPALWALIRLVPPGRATAAAVRAWCRTLLALAGCRVQLDGQARLDSAGPAVLVANHSSYLDVVVLLAALPVDVRFVAKRELTTAPLIGTIIERAGHLTVERVDRPASVADAARATTALRDRQSLLFFPEGTFVRSPGILPFRLGAFRAAVETGRPVVPIALRGTRRILPPDRWLLRHGTISISVAPPLWPEA